ncbi:MAG: tetratricopeptide repeat protein [Okeania sp. SIO3C4]|nr:tetratricopeptide repeat protein [Okeania sp. SIO3B3]NER03505.1 tetratricopeptide repeat protein [Okeania sp. SIO3C4]
MSLNKNIQAVAFQKQQQAENYLSQGKLEAAYAICQNILTESPNFAPAHNTQGKVLQAMGKIESAIASYYQAIKLNPQEIETYQKLGDLLVEQKLLKQAIICYKTAIKFHSKESFFHHKLGLVLMQLQNWDEAVDNFCSAIKLNPNFSWSYNKLGEAFIKLKQWNKAIIAYRHFIEINPNLYISYKNLGDALIQLSKWDEAIAAYQRAIEINPNFYSAHHNLGEALIQLEKWSEAVAVYQFAITHKSQHNFYQKLGYVLKQLSRLDEAANIYQKAIQIKPDNFWNYEALLQIYMLQNQWSEASVCLKKSLEINTNYQDFGIKLGYAKEKVVALTYDDGPNQLYTHQILNVLDSCQVKATFFFIGKYIEKYPELVKLTLVRGHELANHSYSHRNMAVESPELIKSEIEKTDLLLRQLYVTNTIRFRPPYGRQSPELIELILQMQKQLIMWNVDSEDYLQKHSAESIANKVINHVRNGSIILLHDKSYKTVKATEIIIKNLKNKGYSFKTVSDILT